MSRAGTTTLVAPRASGFPTTGTEVMDAGSGGRDPAVPSAHVREARGGDVHDRDGDGAVRSVRSLPAGV